MVVGAEHWHNCHSCPEAAHITAHQHQHVPKRDGVIGGAHIAFIELNVAGGHWPHRNEGALFKFKQSCAVGCAALREKAQRLVR